MDGLLSKIKKKELRISRSFRKIIEGTFTKDDESLRESGSLLVLIKEGSNGGDPCERGESEGFSFQEWSVLFHKRLIQDRQQAAGLKEDPEVGEKGSL